MCITIDDYQVIDGCISGLRESCEGHGGLVGREQNIIDSERGILETNPTSKIIR